MSRIGFKAIEIPEGVEIKIDENNLVTVKGPKGTLQKQIGQGFVLKLEDGVYNLSRPSEDKKDKSLHGLYRSLVQNMIDGVTKGFEKKLLIEGTGYRAQKKGKTLVLNLGYSHDIKYEDEDSLTTECPDDRTIIVRGIDKQAVGNLAANIRACREPEPYKGKGVRYENEYVRRKVGKTGK